MIKTSWSYIKTLIKVMSWQVPLALILMVILSLTIGTELMLLIPLLKLMGIEGTSGSFGKLARFALGLFQGVGAQPTLITCLAGYVLMVSAHAWLSRLQSAVNMTLQTGLATNLRERLYRAIVNTNWLYFSKKRSSDFTHALTEQIERVDSLTYHFLTLISDALVTPVYILLAVQLSAAMTGAVFMGGAALLFLLRSQTKKAHRIGEEVSEATNRMYAAVIEHMAGIKTTKSYNAEEQNINIFSKLIHHVAQIASSSVKNMSQAKCWFDIGSVVILGFVLYVSFHYLQISAAAVLLLLYIFSRIMPRFSSLEQNYQMFINFLPAFRAVTKLEAECLSRAEPKVTRKEKIEFKRAIQLERIGFSYYEGDNHPPLFQNLNLTIRTGQTTAIVGPSGSGKSTIADLIIGLITPQEGRLLVDDLVLGPGQIESWRDQIGYVAQDTFLFHDTVRANLLWACPSASYEDLKQALRFAQCEEFIPGLPRGIEAVVGDRGVLLSGGERQRLALARALLRQPSLLVLDEATSSLDSENENRILKAIEGLHGQMTILVISHRLSTVQKADVIHVLDEGQFVESGNWDELATHGNGRFRTLLNAQWIDRKLD